MLRKISCVILAAFFTAAGANHFISPATYLPMMPGFLPWSLALIYLSGIAEMVGGIGLLFPKWRVLAGWWLIALLVAVFPANIHMLTNDVPLVSLHLPRWVLWVRLPLQPVFIAMVYLAAIARRKPLNS